MTTPEITRTWKKKMILTQLGDRKTMIRNQQDCTILESKTIANNIVEEGLLRSPVRVCLPPFRRRETSQQAAKTHSIA